MGPDAKIVGFFFFNNLLFYLFLIVLGLHCCLSASRSFSKRAFQCSGFSCCGARTLGYSGFSSCSAWAQWLWHMGSSASGIFPDRESNSYPLHWQVGSYQLCRQGSLVWALWTLSVTSACLSPPSLSSRGSLVPLRFLQLERHHLHIWGCWYFSQHLCLDVKKKTEIWYVKKNEIWISSALPLCSTQDSLFQSSWW